MNRTGTLHILAAAVVWMLFSQDLTHADTAAPEASRPTTGTAAPRQEVCGITEQRLRQKKTVVLSAVAADVRLQRQTIAEFEVFVTWMSSNLAGYNRYIQAGSYAAAVGRVLPVPYAGQAAVFTKFIAQFTLSLNEASVAMSRYLTSSQTFLAAVNTLDPDSPGFAERVEASQATGRELVRDSRDVILKLSAVSDLSAGALSFLQTLNQYASSTDEYLNKVKGWVKKDPDPKEKSFLSESTGSLKNQAERFNGRLQLFRETGERNSARMATLVLYDELIAELTQAAAAEAVSGTDRGTK